MKKALALSCNQYFYQVAEKIRPEVFLRLLRETGVQALGSLGRTPGETNKDQAWTRPEALMGLDATLRFEPLQLLRAYLALLVDASGTIERISFRAGRESATSNIAAGLRLSSLLGTSVLAQKALPPNQPLLGKTGTSPGLVGGHYASDKTDGWFIGLYPAPQPTLAVMIYYPNGLGAKHAAPLGGLAMRTYLELVRQ
jgi:cell division protein FtsI/penicillin-binding protein 2